MCSLYFFRKVTNLMKKTLYSVFCVFSKVDISVNIPIIVFLNVVLVSCELHKENYIFFAVVGLRKISYLRTWYINAKHIHLDG